MNIAFIGLGKLGLPCAEVIAGKGHSVTGYDIEIKDTRHITVFTTIEAAVKDRDIVFMYGEKRVEGIRKCRRIPLLEFAAAVLQFYSYSRVEKYPPHPYLYQVHANWDKVKERVTLFHSFYSIHFGVMAEFSWLY